MGPSFLVSEKQPSSLMEGRQTGYSDKVSRKPITTNSLTLTRVNPACVRSMFPPLDFDVLVTLVFSNSKYTQERAIVALDTLTCLSVCYIDIEIKCTNKKVLSVEYQTLAGSVQFS